MIDAAAMNPVLKTRRSITAYALCAMGYAVFYAFAFAAVFPDCRGFAWINALLVWVLGGIEGIVLWNVLRYAVPDVQPLKRFVAVAAGILGVGSIVGSDMLAAYVGCPRCFGSFARQIPLRVFCNSLAYAVLLLWYETHFVQESVEETACIAEDDAPVKTETIARITVRTGGRVKVIGVDEIDYIAAEGDYVAITTRDGRWLKEQTMKYFEENLPAGDFVRIHRSYIVALGRITRIERYGKLYQVTLGNGEKLKVSAGGYKLLKERLNL